MKYFEFYMALATFAVGFGFLALLFWIRVSGKLAAHRKYIRSLKIVHHDKGDVVPFDEMVEEDDLWIVTGDHPQLGRPDQGGLNDNAAKDYARSLEHMGFENIRFIKQN